MDFGVVHLMSSNLTRTGTMMGTRSEDEELGNLFP